MSLPWKGNVRELDNVIEHAMILGDGDWITVARSAARAARQRRRRAAGRRRPARRDARLREGAHPVGARASSNNDKRVAAERLGVSLSSLYRKIEELGVTGGGERTDE